jgi:hypothetical protein
VEHLNILTDQCKGMMPHLFEAIVFLKQNHLFWDAPTVAKAMVMAKGVMAKK